MPLLLFHVEIRRLARQKRAQMEEEAKKQKELVLLAAPEVAEMARILTEFGQEIKEVFPEFSYQITSTRSSATLSSEISEITINLRNPQKPLTSKWNLNVRSRTISMHGWEYWDKTWRWLTPIDVQVRLVKLLKQDWFCDLLLLKV